MRLRSLFEESSRMEVERRAALAARIDSAQQQERESIRDSRRRALNAICENGPAAGQAQQRTTEWSNAETAAWREQQLRPLAQAAARRVAEGRDEFLERRKERRQVESVLNSEKARTAAEQERRSQRELDDWFGLKQIRQRRRRNPEKILTDLPADPANSGNEPASSRARTR
jgi:hypothetical protein